MNKYLTILSIGVLLSTGACAQEQSGEEVPEAVKAAFSQKFPTAKKVSWDMESATEWEAEFKLEGNEYSANFLADGTWQETEHEIKKADIPEAIKQTLAQDFAGFKIEEAEISEKADGSVYELAVEKGEEEWELVFDINGKLIEKKAIEEDDED
ncbi:PepSY-like domain-containing protein [Algoriphagus aquimarinus]|uniref:Putative beta-lactamase-inhibitor-like, PepSY-like n=1 Tax=Algoriphagus aquimarinus TaxID=237018 RepID=A0A1I1BQB0_9BACT|nr:PepSY-like domain-containing protein [Algoriphagus aquimarinus]SFB52481.1 Putative beta-lactamase-inhibitor-like, PepSY-like [Algoriphagus aquimarinus]